MPARQLRLFDPPKPLLQTLGAPFFRRLPESPGVYLMSDRHGRIIYIGQSKNLRARVSSYKQIHPDRASRKMVRLVHAVETVRWEEYPTAKAARIRETELLRLHQPRFNTANTYPPTYLFISLLQAEGQLHLAIGPQMVEDAPNYGAFKRASLRGYAALLRLVWTALERPLSIYQFPGRLLSTRVPSEFGFCLEKNSPTADWRPITELQAFLEGSSAAFLDRIQTQVAAAQERLTPFQRALHADDLETARAFFHYGPARNFRLGQLLARSQPLIAPDELDELLVMWEEALPRLQEAGVREAGVQETGLQETGVGRNDHARSARP